MYADPEDLVKSPQLPPRKYEESEHGIVPIQDTGQVCVQCVLVLVVNALLMLLEMQTTCTLLSIVKNVL